MDNRIIAFWENNCLPVESSIVEIPDHSFPTTELHLLCEYEHLDGVGLRAKTMQGECLTIHRSVALSRCHNRMSHNFDRANCRPIDDLDEQKTFESYSHRIVLMDAFIGDQFIDNPDPDIDKIVYKSADLALLSKMTLFAEEDSLCSVLFENEYVCITFDRDSVESYTLFKSGSDYSYSLVFEFKRSTALEWAVRCWVNPIVNLLSIVLCGDIVEDDVVFYSKCIGAEFRRLDGFCQERDERNQPRVEKMLFPYKDMRHELAGAISSWMERPSTLRGISDVYCHARYRDLLEEVRFSFSMRLAEAAFADPVIADVFVRKGLSRLPDGVVDLDDKGLQPVRSITKKLSSSWDYPFRNKLSELGSRFDQVYREAGLVIDWESCAKECKRLRDAEAHGTLLGGLPQTEFDKMYALEQAALLFYELSVLDLFPIDVDEKSRAQGHLFKIRRRNVGIDNFWSRRCG